ncbi:hypothetical protein BDN70DRAFT_900923 [Pholiota conissans]|uniref:Uncharacterized protein n=1 Tax=Pholiota conissans TaxID=109636 RepID=A0A9P6CSB5_9AGAR|nr:hypothetical protein BDN70DRAFT_900923 [Pholiota conissans]
MTRGLIFPVGTRTSTLAPLGLGGGPLSMHYFIWLGDECEMGVLSTRVPDAWLPVLDAEDGELYLLSPRSALVAVIISAPILSIKNKRSEQLLKLLYASYDKDMRWASQTQRPTRRRGFVRPSTLLLDTPGMRDDSGLTNWNIDPGEEGRRRAERNVTYAAGY